MPAAYIKSVIKTVPNYPKPGILFRDVTSILADHKAYTMSIELLVKEFAHYNFDKVAGTEARGFLFGAPLAIELGIGFIPVRKPNKLPRKVICETYELEYGTDSLEIHEDAVQPGEKILMLDDLLATGGTMIATANLIRRLGGIVEHAGFVISLPALGGDIRLNEIGVQSHAICEFDGE